MRPLLKKKFAAITACVAAAFTLHGAGSLPEPTDSARMLRVTDEAWAGSSVNVIANQRNALITDENLQFTAFYDADGALILGRRNLGDNDWTLKPTGQTAEIGDAHRTAAIAIDVQGFIHLVWGGHGSRMNYARSLHPYGLDLGSPTQMDGVLEDRFTYPTFLRLPDKRLLFMYRHGSSGNGNLVLKRYDPYAGGWTTLHRNLVSGEDERNPYATAFVTNRGTVHLAWTWRETSNASTNHDICYARSEDGGETWTTSTGQALELPITTANAERALRIPQGSSLMNPPAISSSWRNNPYIVTYWDDGDGVPQLRLLFLGEDGQWQASQITQRKTPFTLSGGGTRRLPISRAEVLVQSFWNRPESIYVVYRDDERDGRIVVAISRSADRNDWTFRELTAGPVGAWEPAIDPEQWRRMLHIQMLVQNVEQRDGDDSSLSGGKCSPLGQLIWSPKRAFWTHHTEPGQQDIPKSVNKKVEPGQVVALLEHAADWQLANPSSRDATSWVRAPFFIGALELSKISPNGQKYEEAVLNIARDNNWQTGHRFYHADDHCIIQAYAELWERHGEDSMLQPSIERLTGVIEEPAPVTLHWDTPADCLDRWSWCDALFMAPASFAMLYNATGDERFLNFMDKEWRATTAHLYDPEEQLYFRDGSYFDLREPNGKNIYWSRGNGWVAAGLCRLMENLPQDFRGKRYYRELYGELMESVLKTQQPDGLWRPGLLDPVGHPEKETSGSSFFTYALAWGVNSGLLERNEVEPAIRRAWNALAACVNEDGKLTHVQPIGAAPDNFDPQNSESFAVGAFILAGVEIFKMYGGE